MRTAELWVVTGYRMRQNVEKPELGDVLLPQLPVPSFILYQSVCLDVRQNVPRGKAVSLQLALITR